MRPAEPSGGGPWPRGGRPAQRWATAVLVAALTLLGACSADDPDTAAPPEAGQDDDAAPTDGEPVDGADADPADGDDEPGDVAADRPEPRPTEAVEPPPEPPTRPALRAALEDVVAAARVAAPDAGLGVLVVDEAGREVVASDADLPLLPASTLKQVTAAAALTTLGAEARLRTVVDATGGIDGSGRLDGDLVVIGSGDPTLVTEEYARFIYPARPRTSLASLADQLVEAGLSHLTGDVRGTAPAFAPASLPAGWRDAYLSSLDGRYAAGLTVDGGLRTLLELPEVPDDEEVEDDDEAAEEGADDADDAGPPVALLDQLAALDTDLPPTVRVSLAEDPALHTVTELTRLLRERGVTVDGAPTVGPPEGPTVARLAAVDSPPLADILRFTVQRSDNHLADALALAVGRARTGEGSWNGAHRAFLQVLARFGVPADGAVFADGSGLSREDRVTARLLVELDRGLTGDPRFGGTWRSLQAVAGRSGTLERRLVGTAADGRLLAKTGTLRDVSALSGQVIAADADPEGAAGPRERRYHLAVLANGADGTGRAAARAVVDELALALVADLDGCDVVQAGDEDGPLGRPPSTVRCPTA